MSETILIVEDHDAVRRSLRDWLAVVLPQAEVIEAASGEAALAIVQDTSPSLVLMDVTLPGMNGIETTRLVKAAVPSARIVMLTIHEDVIYRANAAAAGASAYVPKGVMQTVLLPTLLGLLAERAAEETML